MTTTDKTLVYIGRFAPFHVGHKAVVDWALGQNPSKLLIIIGSADAPRSHRTPFTAQEREKMIRANYPTETKIDIAYLQDHPYNQGLWEANLDTILDDYPGEKLFVRGRPGDMAFQDLEYEFIDGPIYDGVSGTDIREKYFDLNYVGDTALPEGTRNFLTFWPQEHYNKMAKEYEHVANYRAANSTNQYPAAIFCADAVVIWRQYVLMVKRKGPLGAGLWALPGGHVNPGEEAVKAAKRELEEETNLDLDDSYPLFDTCFSSPSRDPRGRCITQAFLFDLPDTEKPPTIEAGDDAAEVAWLAIDELNRETIYADHIHIIREMTGCL